MKKEEYPSPKAAHNRGDRGIQLDNKDEIIPWNQNLGVTRIEMYSKSILNLATKIDWREVTDLCGWENNQENFMQIER